MDANETTHKHGVNLNSNFRCFPGSVPDLICEATPPVSICYMIQTLHKELAKKQVYQTDKQCPTTQLKMIEPRKVPNKFRIDQLSKWGKNRFNLQLFTWVFPTICCQTTSLNTWMTEIATLMVWNYWSWLNTTSKQRWLMNSIWDPFSLVRRHNTNF